MTTAAMIKHWRKRATKTLNRSSGLAIAQAFYRALLTQGFPAQRVVVYGSVARGEAGEDSDLDIAVISKPFAKTRHEENMILRRIRRDIDVRIEPISLHPADFRKPYFPIPYAVEQEGIDVSITKAAACARKNRHV